MTTVQWHWRTFDTISVPELYAVTALREAVFIVEQTCPYQDADGLDAQAEHLLGLGQDGQLVAYLRVLGPGLRFKRPGDRARKRPAQRSGPAAHATGSRALRPAMARPSCGPRGAGPPGVVLRVPGLRMLLRPIRRGRHSAHRHAAGGTIRLSPLTQAAAVDWPTTLRTATAKRSMAWSRSASGMFSAGAKRTTFGPATSTITPASSAAVRKARAWPA